MTRILHRLLGLEGLAWQSEIETSPATCLWTKALSFLGPSSILVRSTYGEASVRTRWVHAEGSFSP